MRLSKELLGKSVISADEGRHLGTVKDLYLDESLNWLAGIHLGSEGLFSRSTYLVTREDVLVFGIDAILVKHSGVVMDKESAPDSDDWLRLDKLKGREVSTPGGTKLATIGDVLLGEGGAVLGFGLARTFVEGPIAEARRITRDVVVETGGQNRHMTIDLSKAEQEILGAIASEQMAEITAADEEDMEANEEMDVAEPALSDEIPPEDEYEDESEERDES